MFLLLGDAGGVRRHLWDVKEFPSILLSTKWILLSISRLRPGGGRETHRYFSIMFWSSIVFLGSLYMWTWCVAAGALSLGLSSGLLLAVPIPEEQAAAGQHIQEAIEAAVAEAR